MAPFLAEARSATRAVGTRPPGRPRPRSRRPAKRSPRSSGARPAEVVFTAGGTEADNLGGEGRRPPRPRRRAARRRGHHRRSSTRACWPRAIASQRRGSGSRRLPVPVDGRRRPRRPGGGAVDDRHRAGVGDAREQRGRHDPAARRDRALGSASARRGALVHTDAVQAVPWLDVARGHGGGRPGGDLGPQVRRSEGHRRARGARRRGARAADRRWRPGAGPALRHVERRRRGRDGGGAARRRRRARRRGRPDRAPARPPRRRPARDACPTRSRTAIASAKVAGNAHVGFRGVEAETLLVALDQAGVCAAAGSSCSSGATEPSHVLGGDGHRRATTRCRRSGSSLGYASTDADVDVALDVIPTRCEQLRRAAA